MTLPLVPVADAKTRHNFETLAQLFPLGPQHLQETVLKLAVAGTKRKVAFGSTSVVTSAGTSGTFTVTHGLGTTPVVAFVIADGATANDLTVGTSGYTGTQFTGAWRRASGAAAPDPITFYWVAIG